MWHSSVICVFELVYLIDLLCDEYVDDIVKEVDVKGVLKSSIFVIQKATASKTGVQFCQRSIGAIRSSLATSYDAVRRSATSPKFFLSLTHKLTNEATYRGGAHLKIYKNSEEYKDLLY